MPSHGLGGNYSTRQNYSTFALQRDGQMKISRIIKGCTNLEFIALSHFRRNLLTHPMAQTDIEILLVLFGMAMPSAIIGLAELIPALIDPGHEIE